MTHQSAPGPTSTPDHDPFSYAVITCGDEWRVLTARRQFGHFRRQASAWAVVVELAKEAVASGHKVELYVQNEQPDVRLNVVYRTPEVEG